MPTYLFRCKTHGIVEIQRRMVDAHHPAYCRDCLDAAVRADGAAHPNEVRRVDVTPHIMRRVYTAPRVQNLSASENTLRTWGRDLRVERDVTDTEGLIRARRARDAALAREGAPPPRAATMTTEGDR